MIKKLLFAVILSVIAFQMQAQEAADYKKVKFGKLDIAEFETKSFGKDSAAAAVVLFDIGKLRFGINTKGRWVYILEKHKRIKILSKEGSKYGNFEVSIFQNSSYKEELKSVKTASYNLVDGKVQQNKSSKDEKFKDEVNENYTKYKYTVSDVQEGSIVEIEYEIQSDVIYTLRDWYFQSEIPTIWSELNFSLPEYFDYKVNFQNTHPLALENEESKTETLAGMVDGGTGPADSFNINYITRVRRWTSKYIPAFKNESFITTDDDYLTKVSFEIQSTRFPNDMFRNYALTWEKIVESYKESERFGGFIKPNGYSRKFVATLISETDDTRKKATKIFNYVKQNINWNGHNGDYSTVASPKIVIDKKSGNIGDINLTLLNLLQSAELNAKPLILSTRSNGRHPGHPMSSKFNYVVVKLTVDSSSYLLDASNTNNAPDLIATNALNHEGFLLDLDAVKGEWITIEPRELSSSFIINTLTFDNDLKLKVASLVKKSHYDGLNFRRKRQAFSTESEYLKDYTSDKTGLNILKYEASEIKDPTNLSVEKIDYEVNDYIEEAGNLVYFNPLMYERTKENPFKEEVRNFPVDFAYPRSESYRVVITIPDGYVLDKLPESINYKLEDNSASFLYSCMQSGNQVLVTSRISVIKTVFRPENYPGLKELFKHIVAKQSQPLVLKKI